MSFIALCKKCGSIHTREMKSRAISAWLQRVAGYLPLGCNNCGHCWKELSPTQILFNLVYLLLAVEIIFLITNS